MTEQDFSNLYNSDVDFKDLVGYVKALVKVNRFFSDLGRIAFEKLEVDGVSAKDVQVVLDGMYRSHVQKHLESKATEKLLAYSDKLLTKETHGVQ